ncbi:zinc ABC transporter substrate-binding protein [Saccharibacillus sp. CPCC 101409]|uniref:metal ABC transporter solute-binding protein, Zn/Mn family n=1 Tax=Saccharibacillus sp. CPCC 101409 TaxID=3058041 RepID=UPI002673FA75|nr:zinc ABC transporter substrate-binding protein [Saccharibacillus sp. CPCC 101409]MDO3411007.1 zinc ABC transporter substrate-binding protein [Saccharibacillus sp. CPCC 101409]
MKAKAARKKHGLNALLILLTALLLAGCSGIGSAKGVSENGKLLVTATTGMVADAAAEIGGEYVEVTTLMGPGVDPHLFKASQGDIRKLDRAKIIFYGGLHLEGNMSRILEKMQQSKTVVAVTKNMPEDRLLSGEEEGTEYDPHVWFDVELWMSAARTVQDTLIAEDPANAEAYREQGARYLSELEELDAYVRGRMQEIPEEGRVLVTAHDAFGYFGRAYGVEVVGLQGISTAAEFGARDVSTLRDYLVERGIKAVFVESSLPARSMEAIVAGAAQKGHTVRIGGELFSDAMGEPGTAEGTYIGMVRHNADTIAAALK